MSTKGNSPIAISSLLVRRSIPDKVRTCNLRLRRHSLNTEILAIQHLTVSKHSKNSQELQGFTTDLLQPAAHSPVSGETSSTCCNRAIIAATPFSASTAIPLAIPSTLLHGSASIYRFELATPEEIRSRPHKAGPPHLVLFWSVNGRPLSETYRPDAIPDLIP
jgi:hypothetical protein